MTFRWALDRAPSHLLGQNAMRFSTMTIELKSTLITLIRRRRKWSRLDDEEKEAMVTDRGGGRGGGREISPEELLIIVPMHAMRSNRRQGKRLLSRSCFE